MSEIELQEEITELQRAVIYQNKEIVKLQDALKVALSSLSEMTQAITIFKMPYLK